MTENINSEQPPIPPIWAYFCENEDENQAMTNGSDEEAFNNILSSDDSQFLIWRVENLVQKRLANCITGSQIRKLFDCAMEGQLPKTRIQLIYIAARQNNDTAYNFARFVRDMILSVNDNNAKMKSFQLFIESVVSYHKYYSKK
jgi:CRISPR type III-A-associated protein Csm2